MSYNTVKAFLLSSLSLLAVDAVAQKSDAEILKEKKEKITAYLDKEETIIPFSQVSSEQDSSSLSLQNIPNLQSGWYDAGTILAHSNGQDNISYINEREASNGQNISHAFSLAGLKEIQETYTKAFAEYGMNDLRIILVNIGLELAMVTPAASLNQMGIPSEHPAFVFSTKFLENSSLNMILNIAHHEKDHVEPAKNITNFLKERHRYEARADSVMAESIGFEKAKQVLKDSYQVQKNEIIEKQATERQPGIPYDATKLPKEVAYYKSFDADPKQDHPSYGLRILMLDLLQDAKKGDATLYNTVKQKNNL